MEDFRVGSIAPEGSYSDRTSPDARNRKKDKHTKAPIPPAEDMVLFSERSDDDDVAEDYYTPSRRDDD